MDFHRSSAWKAMILSINKYPIANKILWGILKCFGKSFMNRKRRPTIIIGPTISISQNKGSSMRTSNPRTTGIRADGIRKHVKKLNITLLKIFLFIVLLFLFIYGIDNIFFSIECQEKRKILWRNQRIVYSNFNIGHAHIPFHITSCGVLCQWGLLLISEDLSDPFKFLKTFILELFPLSWNRLLVHIFYFS